MEESALLRKINEKENQLKLNNITVMGIPLWRVFRYKTRLYYLNKTVGFKANTGSIKTEGKPKLKILSGLWQYIRAKELTLIFPFNRLAIFDGFYLDKFTDPVIEQSELKNGNFVIIDPAKYISGYNRIHKDKTLSNESRTISIILLRILFKCIVPILYRKEVEELFEKTKLDFCLPPNFIRKYYEWLSLFLANYYRYLLVFKIIKPRRVFFVFREGFLPLLAACKKLNVPIAEFQHGITLDNTMAYTGDYDSRLDPDYFFTFGGYWKADNFGMTQDRIFNIGWAYNNFLKKETSISFNKNAILVISSSSITDQILDSIAVLAKENPNIEFHIRLHPCEKYNKSQIEKLERIGNARIVDNKIECACALMTYKYILGENSSALYEALSIGCKVGLIDMFGMRPPIDKDGIQNSFFIIRNTEDFSYFLNPQNCHSSSENSFYSEFYSNRFTDFINTHM